MERKVLENASKVIFVTETMKEDYLKKYNWLKDKSAILYWGYNEEDFQKILFDDIVKTDEEILLHAGNIFDYQNPVKFWDTLKNEINNGRKLKIKFIGTVSPAIKDSIEKAGLKDHTEYLGYLNYEDVLPKMMDVSYLLVCATEPRHVPGKLFEYLRTGKPVIAFGNDNDEVKKILNETNAGMIFKYDDDGKEFFDRAKSFKTNLDKVKIFDRKNIAKEFAEIL
jgi:glycosyltransferase involved in cell wall biosynthesis